MQGTGIDQTSDEGFILSGYRVTLSTNIPLLFWVRRTDSTGATLWRTELGESGESSRAQDVQQLQSGHYVAIGYTNFSSNASSDFYLVKILDTALLEVPDDSTSLSISNVEAAPATKLSVFPNPSNGLSSIHITGSNEISELTIRSANGALVYSEDVGMSDFNYNLDASHFPSGFYFITVYDTQGSCLAKEKLIVYH
jgi:hypothetical protein